MRFPLASMVVVVLGFATAGCILPDEMQLLEQDVAQVRREMQDMREDQFEALGQLSRIEQQVADTAEQEGVASREDIADLSVQLQQIARDLANLDQRVADLSGRMQDVAEDALQAREYARNTPAYADGNRPDGGTEPEPGAVIGGEIPNQRAQPDAEALFNMAYADFHKGNYALAISGFKEYEQKFPQKPNADNALYWVAECRFSQGDFDAAVTGFDEMLSRYPNSDMAAAANLKKALAYLEQNDIQRAILQLRYVYGNYSGTDEAKIARDKLTSLGAPV